MFQPISKVLETTVGLTSGKKWVFWLLLLSKSNWFIICQHQYHYRGLVSLACFCSDNVLLIEKDNDEVIFDFCSGRHDWVIFLCKMRYVLYFSLSLSLYTQTATTPRLPQHYSLPAYYRSPDLIVPRTVPELSLSVHNVTTGSASWGWNGDGQESRHPYTLYNTVLYCTVLCCTVIKVKFTNERVVSLLLDMS